MQISMDICLQVPLLFFELMNNTELEIEWCKTCSEFASLSLCNEYFAKKMRGNNLRIRHINIQ
jgi:hypothetical protein